MKEKYSISVLIFAVIGSLLILVIINGCREDCYDFDYSLCPDREDQYIILKFNMDSTTNGFTKEELENVELTYAREFYTEERQPVTKFMGFDFDNYVFKAMYSFYCCGDGNAGIKIFNNNTDHIQVVTDVDFDKERKYGYCCGYYYTVKRFDFNGVRKSDGDTLYINND